MASAMATETARMSRSRNKGSPCPCARVERTAVDDSGVAMKFLVIVKDRDVLSRNEDWIDVLGRRQRPNAGPYQCRAHGHGSNAVCIDAHQRIDFAAPHFVGQKQIAIASDEGDPLSRFHAVKCEQGDLRGIR